MVRHSVPRRFYPSVLVEFAALTIVQFFVFQLVERAMVDDYGVDYFIIAWFGAVIVWGIAVTVAVLIALATSPDWRWFTRLRFWLGAISTTAWTAAYAVFKVNQPPRLQVAEVVAMYLSFLAVWALGSVILDRLSRGHPEVLDTAWPRHGAAPKT